MKTLRENFEGQITTSGIITDDILSKIEYRRVWSGEMIVVGDKVLYAFVMDKKDSTQLFLMSLLEREIDELSKIFECVDMKNETVPILKYR